MTSYRIKEIIREELDKINEFFVYGIEHDFDQLEDYRDFLIEMNINIHDFIKKSKSKYPKSKDTTIEDDLNPILKNIINNLSILNDILE